MLNLRPLYYAAFAVLIALSLSACKNSSSSKNTDVPASHAGQALLGPLSGAAVEVYALSTLDAAPLYTTQTKESDDLMQAGRFSIPSNVIQNDEWYVIKISGGMDIDADDDGIKDTTPTPNLGAIHALLSAAQIRRGDYHVTILSEVLYRRLAYLLSTGYSKTDIEGELNYRAAVALLEDIDGDGDRDGDDIARWQPRLHGTALRHGAQRYANLSAQVRAGMPLGNEAFMATEWTVGTVRLSSPSFPWLPEHQFALGDGMIAATTPSNPPAFNAAVTEVEIINISEPVLPETKATVTVNGIVTALAVQGRYIYLVSDGLKIIDATDLTNPIVVASLELPSIDFLSMLSITGNQLYLASNGRLYSIDITDPAAPKHAAWITYTGSARFISHHQHTVYIVTDNKGIKLFDVSDPTTPVAAGTLPIRANSGLNFLEGAAYVIDYAGTLHIADVSNPYQPRIIDAMPLEEGMQLLGTKGNELYIGVRSTLHVYDISSPTQPKRRAAVEYPGYLVSSGENPAVRPSLPAGIKNKLVVTRQGHELRLHDLSGYVAAYQTTALAHVSVPGDVLDVDIKNSVAYLSSMVEGMHTVDISNVFMPRLLGSLNTPGFVTKAVDGGDALYLNTFQGVARLDITQPASLAIEATTDHMNTSVARHGSMLYELDASGVLRIFDATIPLTPIPVGTLYLSGYSYDFALDETGRLACVMNFQHGMLLIDVSVPSTPVILSALDAVKGNRSCRLHKNHAYVHTSFNTSSPTGIYVIDATDPRKPRVVTEVPLDGFVSDLLMDGDRMYVISNQGLIVYDLSNPATPVFIRVMNSLGTIYNAHIRNNIALTLGGGLRLLDLSDLSKPVELGTLPFLSNGTIAVEGTTAYVVGYSSTSVDLMLYVIDISDVTQPTLVATTSIPQGSPFPPIARNITVIKDTAYLAGWYMGLLSFDVSNASQPVLAATRTSPIYLLRDIIAVGNYVYATDVTAPLPVIDFSNPTKPVFTGLIDSDKTDYPLVLAAQDGFLYAASDNLFSTYDLSDPTRPSKIGSVEIPDITADPYTMIVHGSLAIVAYSNDASLTFIDITNPVQPMLAGTLPLLSPGSRFASAGGKLYVATAAGVHIINTRNPTHAYVEAIIPGNYTAVTTDGDYLFLGGEKNLSVTPLMRRRLP